MKTLRKTVIIFTVLMLLALALFTIFFFTGRIKTEVDTAYTAEQLAMYKEIRTDLLGSFEAGRVRQYIVVLVFWAVVLVSGYVALFIFYEQFLKPVRAMQEHAADIARGNLDVTLPMTKNDLFGGFTESFDLMREELRESRKREMESVKAKEEMVAELSHDLKTPVATITATCEVLDMKYRKRLQSGTEEEKRDAEDTIEKIGYIMEKGNVINGITDNLFRATIDGNEEINVNVEEIPSGEIRAFFDNYDEYVNIIVENEMPECLVLADKLRMEQVVDNIIGNSVKYAGSDIRVRFERTEKDAGNNSFIKITIRDEGKGVDPEDLPLITEKFKRGKNSSDKSGYGLGLWLVKYYMEKQGGGMEYYNDNGFVVELLVRRV